MSPVKLANPFTYYENLARRAPAEGLLKAGDEISRLCGSSSLDPQRNWRMSIPVDKRDSDAILSGVLHGLAEREQAMRTAIDELLGLFRDDPEARRIVSELYAGLATPKPDRP